VVTVISELSIAQQETLLPDDATAPFERRVTATLVEGVIAAKEAVSEVRRESRDLTVFQEVVERGVSANLCDAIVLAGTGDDTAEVQVTVDWASGWTPPANRETPTVSFDPADVRVVESGALFLRQLGPFEGVEVEGFVRHLDRGTEDRIGTIVIEGIAAGERRNVYVELADEAYRTAIAAHEERQQVAVRGTLVKDGRHWVLNDPTGLEIRLLGH
jgi:hypothetical protein